MVNLTPVHYTLGETENDDEDSEDYYDNDLDDYYTNQFDEYESLEADEQFSNEKEESEKVDYTYYLCKVGDCGKFYTISMLYTPIFFLDICIWGRKIVVNPALMFEYSL